MLPIPSITTIKLAAIAVGILGLVGGTATVTHKVDNSRYLALQLSYAKAQEQAVAAAAAEQRRYDDVATTQAKREAAAQAALVAHTKRQLKDVSAHVKALSRGCISYGFIRVLDAAAYGRSADDLPLPAGKSDDACAPVDWRVVAGSVTDNYGSARQNAEQLDALIGTMRAFKQERDRK